MFDFFIKGLVLKYLKKGVRVDRSFNFYIEVLSTKEQGVKAHQYKRLSTSKNTQKHKQLINISI